MRIRTVPWVGFVVLGLAALAGAGEPPKDKPKDPPKGDPGAKQPAEPPAAPKPAEDPAKPAPGLINVLLEIERNLKSDEVGKRAKAVQDLVKADSEEPPLLEKIKNLLTLVCNSTHFVPDHRQMAAERICAMAVKHREKASLEFDKKIKAILEAVLTNEKQNADPRVCLPLLRHLLDLGQPEALKLAQSCLKNFKPEGATALLALLRVSANPMVLDVIIEIANDKAGKNLVLRRDCVKWLGLWGNLPPTYAKRIPALLEALDSPATTEAALEALHRICIPSLEQAQAWKNWWKQAQGKDDAAVVREDLKEVFERKTKDEKELGAQRIIEWLGDWNGPCFRWAVPLLLDPLLKYDHGEIRSRVISILGTIGDASAVAPLETLSREIKPEKQSQRVQLREVILGMARIAAPGDEAKRTEVGKTLEGHLDSIHEDIVAAAAEAMGLLRYAHSRNRLVVVLNKTSSMRAAMKAAEALGQMKAQDCLAGTDGDGNLRILPMLAKCLDQSDLTSLALSLVKAVRTMDVRSREVLDHLVQAIACKDDRVCQEAMTILGTEWKEPDALGPINQVFTDAAGRNYPLRKCALEVLANYPPDRAASCLFPVLRSPRASDRKDKDPAKVKRAGEDDAFARIAVQFFDKPGNVLPEHRKELLDIVSGAENNSRPACVRWLSQKGIWKTDECVDSLVLRFDDDQKELVEEVNKAFKAHPSHAAMSRTILALPKTAPPNPRWQDYQKLDVVSWFIYSCYKGEDPPIKESLNGKEIEGWFKKKEKSFEWPAED